MKLYGHPGSTCTRKVLTTLAEKGREAEFVLIDLSKGQQKSPDYLAKHPFGVVPFLEDDGFTLYESRAIIRYLDAKLPGPKLTPSDHPSFGRMEQWLSVEQSYFTPHCMAIVMELVFKPMRGGTPDMDKVNKGRSESARVLDVVDRALMSQAYLAGDTFSLADISWLPYLQYLSATPHGTLITERPFVKSWWQRISTRPSWKKVNG
ncbi:glutathione S-transferase N-terminal domain-containing protein [Archangium violaceum]|uniref:glutathione S-transferase family protein n=1 Tax=Archangium violaceum TaxID=83451 RepID=UPI00193B2981|nr:glutathione S-transferase N-terminal domain-containing protein [Archangium violaceum]QRK09386.1 glutathione S-transferase N-terminal domain-containing protein [Archangium violaceum]